ncbi:BfmA/BtgA family mobilization protein [Emticicia oligotrophica]|uniref:BfmA/BtgA family mobilization protein n=1 Tax=Emticicia oligotrophica TaxID=312279 RepID=UPI00273AF62A|nr:BfmA/BtgA family mobilization protein [Emticicia oligotrophica]
MNVKTQIPIKTIERTTISISKEILEKANFAIAELNVLFDNYEKTILTEHQIAIKEQIKKADKKLKVPQKLTLKVFAEAALLYFIKNKFDPRYYLDDSIATAMNRLRNHILGFIVTQENKYIRPFQQDIIALKNEVSLLKKSLEIGTQTVEETALETQGTLMGLVHILFEMLEIEKAERPKLENLLQQKGIEYIEHLNKK